MVSYKPTAEQKRATADAVLHVMEALGELLALLPGCDVLEEQK